MQRQTDRQTIRQMEELEFCSQNMQFLCRLAERAVGRPLGDFGEPEDIAEAAAFLASAKARFFSLFFAKVR